jgi:putative SOS response-associated peptidase YedK
MCGRYSNTLGPELIARQVADQLGAGLAGAAGTRALNIAPTEQVLAIVAGRERRPPESKLLRWALLPDWASDLKGRPHINARLETVKKAGKFIGVPADAPHRALIVADEFLEWSKAERKGESRPAPFGFSVEGGRAFCFAGLWSTNERVQGGPISSCTILTCDARQNRLVAPIHDRMPVMFADAELWKAWLDPEVSLEEALSLCVPLPAERMSVRPLPATFNDARNKDPYAQAPATASDAATEDSGDRPPGEQQQLSFG